MEKAAVEGVAGIDAPAPPAAPAAVELPHGAKGQAILTEMLAYRDEILGSWSTLPLGTAAAIPRLAEGRRAFSRLLDIVPASIALIVFLPVMLAVALLIKLGTPGPVLFRQKRLGLNGELFTLVKFRTLYVDARQRFPELYAYKYNDDQMKSLVFKSADDPRITPQGRWLRSTSLDELPNFWNVLKGDMAMVGPRPDIPEMLPYYRGEMLRRFSVRPGLTGLSHVTGRSNLTVMDSVALDLVYLDRRSLWFDLEILLRTVLAVALHRGAF